MIVVTGATGHLGVGVVESLLDRLPADRVVATVRDVSKAAEFARRGVTVREGDFADLPGLTKAFAGADQVLIVSVDKLGDEALRLHRTAIEVARSAGARQASMDTQDRFHFSRWPLRDWHQMTNGLASPTYSGDGIMDASNSRVIPILTIMARAIGMRSGLN